MQTSNFANNRIHGLNGISISRYPDRRSGFTGPEFPPLMPPAWLVKGFKEGSMSWGELLRLVFLLGFCCRGCIAVFHSGKQLIVGLA